MDAMNSSAPANPAVSVIIPVYKTEKYLAECIESVLAQTFEDFEMILVDDGTPDDSGKICDTYAARDPRIRVFHKENGGVTSARRFGVERSRGEWITFVDSDDKLFPNALRDLMAAAAAHPDADLAEAAMSREESATRLSSTGPGNQSVLCVTGLEYAVAVASHKMIWLPGPFAKIIRKSVLVSANALDVPAWINFGEDLMMCIRLARRVRKAVRVPAEVYFYRRNPDEACATIRRNARYFEKWLMECERSLPGGIDGDWRKVWEYSAYSFFLATFFADDWSSTNPYSKKILSALSARAYVGIGYGDWRKTRACVVVARMPRAFQIPIRAILRKIHTMKKYVVKHKNRRTSP